jgi:uncharacterized protein
VILKLVDRLDSWISAVTGLGNPARDKVKNYNASCYDPPLDIQTLQNLWSGSDLASRIVKSLPEKAMKQGFNVTTSDGDMEPDDAQEQAAEVMAEADRLGLADKIVEADTWGRLYGLSGIVLGVSGSGTPDQELDDDRATRLDWIIVVDKLEINVNSYYVDPASEKFGEVETYVIKPASSGSGSRPDPIGVIIHETRFIRFGGTMTSRRDRQANAGADLSVLQRVYKVLQQVESNWDSTCLLMSDMSQAVFKVNGLTDLIATGNESLMQARMRFVDMSRSVANAVVLDAEKEDFKREPTPMGGVVEVLQQSWQRCASAAEMPVTVLFGMSPAGLNATGESDMRQWYDNVQQHREHKVAPPLLRILRLVSKTLGHTAPDSWEVVWPSLWQMTAPEQAAYQFQVAQADKIYIDEGVYLPEEVALTRCGTGDEFNGGKVQIDAEARKAALKISIDEITDPTPEPPPVIVQGTNGAPPQLPPKPQQKAA